jgi:hypothetical protein
MDGFVCFVGCELAVCFVVSEVFQYFFYVFGSFKDAGAKVLVRWEDDEFLGAAKLEEELALEGRQVVWNLAPPNSCFDCREEVRNSGTEFNRDRFWIGLPFGADE